MKVIEEKYNHLNKVYRIVCFNCGSTLEYGVSDITYDSRKKPFVICPVCSAMIPHNPGEPTEIKTESKPDTISVQPTLEECEWLPPLNLKELLSGGINVQQKFMLRDGQIATYAGCDMKPNGSLELTMMVGGRFDKYNLNGVRLTYRDGHWCEDDDRNADIIFMI